MGQKVHPLSVRLGFIRDWYSNWFATKKDYPLWLFEDIKIRRHIKGSLSNAAISEIEITRASDRIGVNIYTARPGIIIGRRGADIDRLKDELKEIVNRDIYINIKEVKEPAIEAQLIAENIAFQLERRVAHRRAMKRAIELAMNAGAGGIKVVCAGRLGGVEISRRESYKEGKVPLQTFRADIDYGFAQAHTTYGTIGVKVWVFKGEILPTKDSPQRNYQRDIR
jgi:small subunit ribosomal protein S3